jgi:hypothetical protein
VHGPDIDIDIDGVTWEAYSHEVISAGFWFGDDDVRHRRLARTAPEAGRPCRGPLEPSSAR